MEKCSESIGTIVVWFFLAIFSIMFQPHTIDSLLAKKIFLLYFTNLIVGFNPAIPGIALIVKSLLILRLTWSNWFKILQFL